MICQKCGGNKGFCSCITKCPFCGHALQISQYRKVENLEHMVIEGLGVDTKQEAIDMSLQFMGCENCKTSSDDFILCHDGRLFRWSDVYSWRLQPRE
jgi:hypothetical protein